MYERQDKADVQNLTIEHIPHFSVTLNDTHIIVDLENENFAKCKAKDLKYELQCKAAESEEYGSVVNFTKPAVSTEEYKGTECRVRLETY